MGKKVFIVSGAGVGYGDMFERHGWTLTEKLLDADLVQFTGGQDVSPDLYGHTKHSATHNDPNRDKKEQIIYNMALKHYIPMAGICRGAQFLHVMNGGKLYQDVDKHAIFGTHDAVDQGTGEVFPVTSTHHQMMMRPNWYKQGGPFIFLAAKVSTRRESMRPAPYTNVLYEHGHRFDIEGLFYPATRCVCFQPHPEYPAYPELGERYIAYLNHFLYSKEQK